MDHANTHPILLESIQAMPVSPEFREMARVNGFVTLRDIVDGPLDTFHDLPMSGYRMLKELADILTAHGLEDLLND